MKYISDHRRAILLLIVFLTAFFISLIALKGAFLSDEYEFIYAAARIHSVADFWSIMTSKIGGDFYRPVLYLSFIVDYWIYGLTTWGYHLTNSIIYGLTAVLVSLTVWQLGTQNSSKAISGAETLDEVKKKNLTFIAFFSGILFALLPNHHETVTWLAGRTDLLATLLYIGAIYALVRCIEHRLTSDFAQTKTHSVRWLVAFCIFAALAYATKEISITLIIIQAIVSVWYIFKARRHRLSRKYGSVILALALNLCIVLIYIVVRHSIIGYWFGGYTTSGQSIFLNFTLSTMKRWILSPLLYMLYSINYAYAFALTQRIPNIPGKLQSYENFISYIQFCIYGILFFITCTTLFLAKRRRAFTRTLGVLGFAALFFYMTALPVVGVLPTLSRTLESSRFLYLSSIGVAVVIAYWLSLWKGKLRVFITAGTCLVLLLLYFFNYRPWLFASRSSASIRSAVAAHQADIKPDDWIYVVNVPDNIYGAYVFRRGLPHMFYLELGEAVNTAHVIMTGRGISGTHAPECINAQSDQYYVMHLDEVSGVVQSFGYVKRTVKPPDMILRLEGTRYELNDIVRQDNGSYRIIGSNPYITFTDLAVDPKKITDIILSTMPEHPYLWGQWDLYWTTETSPSYDFFQKHFWFFQDNTPDKIDTTKMVIPVCQYPAFVFSDTIKTIRIRFPYRLGEIFRIKE